MKIVLTILSIALLLPMAQAMEVPAMGVRVEAPFQHDAAAFAYTTRADEVGAGIDSLHINAKQGHGWTFVQRGPYADATACQGINETWCDVYGVALDQPSDVKVARDPDRIIEVGDRFPESGEFHQWVLKATSFEEIQRLQILAINDGVDVNAIGGRLDAFWVEKPCTSSQGIQEESDVLFVHADDPENMCKSAIREDLPSFHSLALPGPALVQNSTAPTDFIIRGDMIVELFGITLTRAGVSSETYYSGGQESFGAGLPVGEYTKTTVRLVLEDATLRVHHEEEVRFSEWAVSNSVTSADGGIFLVGQDGDTLRSMDGAYRITSEAQEDGALFTFDPLHPQNAAPAGFLSAASASWALLLLLIPLVVGIGLALRRRSPSMDQVEAALDAGEFTRAAKLSTRIIRKQPRMESAHLSRAISMTRLGRPTDAIAKLSPFLETNDPQDGTLHYVLGMAFLDIGKRDEATEAFKDAVARTPELLSQIAPDLEIVPKATEGYS